MNSKISSKYLALHYISSHMKLQQHALCGAAFETSWKAPLQNTAARVLTGACFQSM